MPPAAHGMMTSLSVRRLAWQAATMASRARWQTARLASSWQHMEAGHRLCALRLAWHEGARPGSQHGVGLGHLLQAEAGEDGPHRPPPQPLQLAGIPRHHTHAV